MKHVVNKYEVHETWNGVLMMISTGYISGSKSDEPTLINTNGSFYFHTHSKEDEIIINTLG